MFLDRKEYIEKAENVLAQPAYMTLDRDPNNKFITTLRKIKREAGIDEGMYKTMYPTSCTPQHLSVTQNH